MEKKHDPPKSPKPNHVDNWFTYLNADKVQLLKELVEQTTNPVLIPYVNYGVEKCVDQYVGYANDSSIRKEFQLSEERKEHTTINADFIDIEIKAQYHTILLTPPLNPQKNTNHKEEYYIQKCLDLMAPGGRLIAVLSRGFLSGRSTGIEKIRSNLFSAFSIKAVIDIQNVYSSTMVRRSILVIEKKHPTGIIQMITDDTDCKYVSKILHDSSIGFSISLEDAIRYNRLDPIFFKPEFKTVRDAMLNRNTIKLGDIARVSSGLPILKCHSDQGDYLIIHPQHLSNGKIDLENKRRDYVNKEDLDNSKHYEKAIRLCEILSVNPGLLR